MVKFMLTLIAITMLIGCTSKEHEAFIQAYEKNKNYHMQLQKTEKIQLYHDQATKVMLTATYLFKPSVDANDKHDEIFIVGLYTDDEEISSLSNKEYTLMLNSNISPKSIKVLEENDPILNDISFVSEWSQFYLVTFPHISSKSFKLVFESCFYGKGELNFAKVSKFVLTKKAF